MLDLSIQAENINPTVLESMSKPSIFHMILFPLDLNIDSRSYYLCLLYVKGIFQVKYNLSLYLKHLHYINLGFKANHFLKWSQNNCSQMLSNAEQSYKQLKFQLVAVFAGKGQNIAFRNNQQNCCQFSFYWQQTTRLEGTSLA